MMKYLKVVFACLLVAGAVSVSAQESTLTVPGTTPSAPSSAAAVGSAVAPPMLPVANGRLSCEAGFESLDGGVTCSPIPQAGISASAAASFMAGAQTSAPQPAAQYSPYTAGYSPASVPQSDLSAAGGKTAANGAPSRTSKRVIRPLQGSICGDTQSTTNFYTDGQMTGNSGWETDHSCKEITGGKQIGFGDDIAFTPILVNGERYAGSRLVETSPKRITVPGSRCGSTQEVVYLIADEVQLGQRLIPGSGKWCDEAGAP